MNPADTAPIRPEERFGEDRVAAYLRTNLAELIGDGPISFEQFPGGKANLTYLARCGAVELVLRRPPLGPVAPGSHDMERECKVLSVLWQAFGPAPRAYHYCPDPEVMGKPFFVMERRRGIVVRESWPGHFGPEHRLRAAEGLVDCLAALHGVDYRALGLEDLGRPDGFVARQVAGWQDRWQRAATRPLADMDRAAGLLGRSIPVPQRATLLHNDFKLDNLMLSDLGRVVAVLDWDMSTLGDPLVDLGTAVAYWADPDAAAYRVFGATAAELAPALSRADAVVRYGIASGLDTSALPYYLGLAYFRIAVIVEQIYARYAAGQTSDPRFASLGGLVPGLAAAACRSLQGRTEFS